MAGSPAYPGQAGCAWAVEGRPRTDANAMTDERARFFIANLLGSGSGDIGASLPLAVRGAARPIGAGRKQRETRARSWALSSATGPCAHVRRGGARFASAQSLGPAQAVGHDVVA